MVEEPDVGAAHPDGVGEVGVGAGGEQVGPGGVAEVAEPLVVGGTCGELGLEHLEHVRADHLDAAAGVTAYLARAGVEGERDVVVVEPADHRTAPRPLAGAAAVEPEAARVLGRDLGEEGDDVIHRATHREPEEVRDEQRAVLAEDRLGMELHALQRERPVPHPHHRAVVAARGHDQGVGHRQRRQRVVAHRLEVLRHPGEDAAPVVRHQRHVAVRGGDAVDHAAVRRRPGPACPGTPPAPGPTRRAAPLARPRSRPCRWASPGRARGRRVRSRAGTPPTSRRAGRRSAARRSPRRAGARGSTCRSRGGRPRPRPARAPAQPSGASRVSAAHSGVTGSPPWRRGRRRTPAAWPSGSRPPMRRPGRRTG